MSAVKLVRQEHMSLQRSNIITAVGLATAVFLCNENRPDRIFCTGGFRCKVYINFNLLSCVGCHIAVLTAVHIGRVASAEALIVAIRSVTSAEAAVSAGTVAAAHAAAVDVA